MDEQGRREIARRLGAPVWRCPRCQLLVVEPLRTVWRWDTEPMQPVTVCPKCASEIDRMNQTHIERRVEGQIRDIRRRAEDEAGLEQAQRDLERQLNEPSSAEYRRACAAMIAEDPYLRRRGR